VHRLGQDDAAQLLSNFIPDDERIVSIEDSAELQLAKDHWIRLETRPQTSKVPAQLLPATA